MLTMLEEKMITDSLIPKAPGVMFINKDKSPTIDINEANKKFELIPNICNSKYIFKLTIKILTKDTQNIKPTTFLLVLITCQPLIIVINLLINELFVFFIFGEKNIIIDKIIDNNKKIPKINKLKILYIFSIINMIHIPTKELTKKTTL